MKNIVLISIIVVLLLVPGGVAANAGSVTLGGDKVGSVTGYGNIPTLIGLGEVKLTSSSISFKYSTIQGHTEIAAIYGRDMYVYEPLQGEFFYPIPYGGGILQVIGTPGGALNPTPRSFFALVSQGSLVSGKMLPGFMVQHIMDVHIDGNGLLLIASGAPSGILLLTLQGSNDWKAYNITGIDTDTGLIAGGRAFLYTDSGTITASPNGSTAQYQYYVFPVVNDENAALIYDNTSLILYDGSSSHVLASSPNIIFAEGYASGSTCIAASMDSNHKIKIYVYNMDTGLEETFVLNAGYTQLTQIVDYYPYTFRFTGEGSLLVVFSTPPNQGSSMLLEASINTTALTVLHGPEAMVSLNYPSSQAQSIINVKLVSKGKPQASGLKPSPTPSTAIVTGRMLEDSSEKRDMETASITTTTGKIMGLRYTITYPEGAVNYGDFELSGLQFTVKVTEPTGLGYQGFPVGFTARIYVNGNLTNTINKTATTDRNGEVHYSITKNDVNASGDIRVEWLIDVDGYTYSGSIYIKYPFPTTTPPTTTPSPGPGPGPTTTPSTTTTTSPATTTGGGAATTGAGGSISHGTTTPGGGLNTGLLIGIIVIVIIIGAAGVFLWKRH